MAIPRCKRCGGYNHITEWPEEEREHFDPDTCYKCARTRSEADDAKEEEPDETDDDVDGLTAVDDAEREVEDEPNE